MGQGEIILSSHVEVLGKYLSAVSGRLRFSNAQKLISQKANATIEATNEEGNAAAAKLEALETKMSEKQQKVEKLEEEVVRLRRAVEESMTRLKSLSSDSDNHVDRRIVIKLLVTYFQKNHSREVRSFLFLYSVGKVSFCTSTKMLIHRLETSTVVRNFCYFAGNEESLISKQCCLFPGRSALAVV
jgi:hypothetical protein